MASLTCCSSSRRTGSVASSSFCSFQLGRNRSAMRSLNSTMIVQSPKIRAKLHKAHSGSCIVGIIMSRCMHSLFASECLGLLAFQASKVLFQCLLFLPESFNRTFKARRFANELTLLRGHLL